MLLAQGVELLIYGMGTVLVFLSLLVVATGAMSALLLRWFPEAAPPQAATPSASNAAGPPPRVLAAIAVAVHRYRRERR